MKCPVCNEEVSELDESCPHCQINFADFEKQNNKEEKSEKERTNADYLNTIANIIIVLSIISAIVLILPSLINLSYAINGYSTDFSAWLPAILGGICLLSGVTLFFLLKTVVDIYRKVES